MASSFQDLLQKYRFSQLSAEERREFFSLVRSGEYDEELKRTLDADWNNPEVKDLSDPETLKLIYQMIQLETASEGKLVVMHRKRSWIRYVAAAAILFALAGSYLIIFKPQTSNPKPEIAIAHDIKAPQINKATITLSDGRQIVLDSAGNGTLITQVNASIIKKSDGEISYQSTNQPFNQSTEYNTLTNPRGSKVISLTLSDGTKVWLNAESSLKYPTAFTAGDRRVEIKGEAYFEVAHDESKPFIVSKCETEVTVLGTHFNVNAYDDEDAIRVTLLQGSVKVSQLTSHVSRIIAPGEQAQINQSTNQPINIINPDLDNVMAWKNGMFLLDNTDLPTIMRQIARWYDLDVVYQGKVPNRKFGGGVSKNLPLSKILELLEANGVHGKVENKKLTLQP